MNGHKLAEILLSMPDLPVRFVDYEDYECKIVGIVPDSERPSDVLSPSILLEITHA